VRIASERRTIDKPKMEEKKRPRRINIRLNKTDEKVPPNRGTAVCMDVKTEGRHDDPSCAIVFSPLCADGW
jgi:hypothetical protein